MQSKSIVFRFVLTAGVLATPVIIAVLTMEKFALHTAVNGHHTVLGDMFFRYATHLADGITPTLLALVLLFVKDLRSFLMMALSCGLSAIVTQLLKRQVFADHDRPAMFRDGLGDMQWVPDIVLNNHFSFPSGHATAAFAMCLSLAVILGRRSWAMGWAVLAALLAFSRVYLSQHFMEDILAGAVIGTAVATLVHHWLYVSPFSRTAWLHRRAFGQLNQ